VGQAALWRQPADGSARRLRHPRARRPRPRRPCRRVFPPPAPALLMPTAATRPLISATPVAAPALGSARFYSEVLDTSGASTARRHPGSSFTTGWQAGAACLASPGLRRWRAMRWPWP